MAVTLPKPLGGYTVGIRHLSFTYDYCGESREVPVYLYYPADDAGDTPAYPYGTEQLYAENPQKDTLLSVKTQMFEGLPLSTRQKSYPVTLFSVGFGCFTLFNSVLCCDLASRGFVVASIAHPGDGAVLFPDGRPAFIDKDKLDTMMDACSPDLQCPNLIHLSLLISRMLIHFHVHYFQLTMVLTPYIPSSD